MEKYFACLCIFVKILNLSILVVYRSPSGPFDTFLDSTIEAFDLGKSVAVLGDFNVHFNYNECKGV